MTAWTAPKTMAAGDVGTSSDWNTHVRDNELYLKERLDVAQSDVTAGRAINGTVYHNTTGRTLLVTVNMYFQVSHASAVTALNGQSYATVVCDSAAAPTTQIAGTVGLYLVMLDGLSGGNYSVAEGSVVTFMVPNGYYYKITGYAAGTDGVAPALLKWFEYAL